MIYQTETYPGRKITIKGKNYLYFGGTAYLGLQTNLEFQELFIEGIKKYGTNYGASRKSNLRLSIFEKAETSLASLVGSEACTTLSSGYLAGQLVAQYFEQGNFKAFFAPNTHAALFQKNTRPYATFNKLMQAHREFKQSRTSKAPVLFLDSIDTPGASYPNFELLKELPLNELIVVVDDSHGIGIMGENGAGAFASIKKLKPKELLVCCSLGKGFGIQAGAVFGTQSRISRLTDTNFFGGASPATPAALATLTQGQPIFTKQRAILNENLQLFKSTLKTIEHFQSIPKHPVFCFENTELVEFLERNNIIITNFKYPTNEGKLMSRIVISGGHTPSDIHHLATSINSYKN